MTTVIGALRPDVGFPAPSNRQADAENQREAWLRQMEMSQIALLQQADTQSGHGPDPSTSQGGNGTATTGAKSGQLNSQIGQEEMPQDNTQANFLPVHPILAQEATAESSNQGTEAGSSEMTEAPPSYTTGTTQLDPAVAQSAAGTASAPLASSAPEPIAYNSALEGSVAPPSSNSMAFSPQTSSAVTPPVSSIASPGANAFPVAAGNSGNLQPSEAGLTTSMQGRPQGNQTPNAQQTVKSQAIGQQSDNRQTVGQLAGAQLSDNGQQAAPIEAAQSESIESALPAAISGEAGPAVQVPQSAGQPISMSNTASVTLRIANIEAKGSGDETETTETEAGSPKRTNLEFEDAGENWQKRMIHVAQDGQDVSLSIRDNTLLPNQSAQIVSRLAGDVAQSGLRLRSATINGKTVLKQSRSNAAATGESGHASVGAVTPHSAVDSERYAVPQDLKEL